MTKKKPILGTVLLAIDVVVLILLLALSNKPIFNQGVAVSCILITLFTFIAVSVPIGLVYVMIKRSEWSNYRDPLASMKTIKRNIESKEESIQHLNGEIVDLKKVLSDYTKK